MQMAMGRRRWGLQRLKRLRLELACLDVVAHTCVVGNDAKALTRTCRHRHAQSSLTITTSHSSQDRVRQSIALCATLYPAPHCTSDCTAPSTVSHPATATPSTMGAARTVYHAVRCCTAYCTAPSTVPARVPYCVLCLAPTTRFGLTHDGLPICQAHFAQCHVPATRQNESHRNTNDLFFLAQDTLTLTSRFPFAKPDNVKAPQIVITFVASGCHRHPQPAASATTLCHNSP